MLEMRPHFYKILSHILCGFVSTLIYFICFNPIKVLAKPHENMRHGFVKMGLISSIFSFVIFFKVL